MSWCIECRYDAREMTVQPCVLCKWIDMTERLQDDCWESSDITVITNDN